MKYELVIIGAGLTGLRAAIQAQKMGVRDVLVVEYEKHKGGYGSSLFGREEFYAEKKLIDQSNELTCEIWYQSTVVGFFSGDAGESHQISVQTPSGTKEVEAEKVIISSGSLEKPREAYKIAGSRPAGVMTSKMALDLLDKGFLPGKVVVLFENDKVTQSVASVLAEKGVNIYRFSDESIKITRINGESRVTDVELFDSQSGKKTCYKCDTLIYSDGYIPSTFYLKGTEVDLDDDNFIIIDEKGRTNVPDVLALGSCTNQYAEYDVLSEETLEAIENFLTE